MDMFLLPFDGAGFLPLFYACFRHNRFGVNSPTISSFSYPKLIVVYLHYALPFVSMWPLVSGILVWGLLGVGVEAGKAGQALVMGAGGDAVIGLHTLASPGLGDQDNGVAVGLLGLAAARAPGFGVQPGLDDRLDAVGRFGGQASVLVVNSDWGRHESLMVGETLDISQTGRLLRIGGTAAVAFTSARAALLPYAAIVVWFLYPLGSLGLLWQRFQVHRGALSSRGRPQDVMNDLVNHGEQGSQEPRYPIPPGRDNW